MTSTATTRSPLLTLNNGVQMPALGLGVFQSPPDETADAVESAITHGYRLIDTAAAYFNERQVGEGLRRSNVRRDEIFLETKVWISDYGYDATLHAFDKATRIAENFAVFDFELSDDQIAALDALETGARGGPEPDSITLEAYGRDIPEP